MIDWQVATLIDTTSLSKNMKRLKFKVPNWPSHKAGQHINIRLTSEDGYHAERDYSLASAPEEKDMIELGVEYLDNGEVSPFLFQIKPSEQIEIRGPIGGHFVWDINTPGPLVMIAGGSGVVPMISMIKHHINNLTSDKNRQIILLLSVKSDQYFPYKKELKTFQSKDPNLKVIITYTQQTPTNWTGYNRRIDQEMLKQILSQLTKKEDNMPMIFVCGPTLFVESIASDLISLDFTSHQIKTERFGG